MRAIYIDAYERYIIVLENMEELMLGALSDNVPYYEAQYRRYYEKMLWVQRKLCRYNN